jgi:hypothetical protein
MSRSLGGGGSREKLRGWRMASTAENLLSAGSILNTAHRWMAVWWIANAPSASGTKAAVTTNNFGTPGVGVIGEGTNGANRAMHVGFMDNKYTSIQARNFGIPCDAEIGTGFLYRDDYWADGTRIWMSRFGRSVSIGTASTMTSFATTNPLAVNRRAAGGAAALGYGDMTVVGIQFSTAVPTQAELASTFRDSPSKPIRSSIAHFAPKDLGAIGGTPTTWIDKIGARALPRANGTPAVVAVRGIARRWCHFVGVTAMATTTQDFADRHTAVGGQCLGVNNGTTPRLDTLNADLDLDGSTDCGVIFNYVVNDLSYRVLTLGQTAQQAADAVATDYGTAIGIVRAKYVGTPILIENCIRMGIGASGESATVRAAIDIYNAQFAAMIAALSAAHGGNIYGSDVCTAVTPTQAAANDTNVLYDLVHHTPASYALHAAANVAAVKATPWTHVVWRVFGDSRAAGRISGGSTAGGWRRKFCNDLCEAA